MWAQWQLGAACVARRWPWRGRQWPAALTTTKSKVSRRRRARPQSWARPLSTEAEAPTPKPSAPGADKHVPVLLEETVLAWAGEEDDAERVAAEVGNHADPKHFFVDLTAGLGGHTGGYMALLSKPLRPIMR